MPLKKLVLKPGINRENTSYTSEGGWYASDKVRFRQGTPEKIGGWLRISANTFLGTCRSLWDWVTLGGLKLIGVGTHLKFYVTAGGKYYDVTPIRTTYTLGADPFSTTDGSDVVTVTDATGGYTDGDFVTFSGGTAVGGLDLNNEYQLTYVTGNTYTITASSAATSTATGGGASVSAEYQINVGPEIVVPFVGWAAGAWGLGTWGNSDPATDALRTWTQSNFGEDLIFGPRSGDLYYWDNTSGLSSRAVALSSLGGASDVPTIFNSLIVSDVSRFVLCCGVNEIGSGILDPMLIRWSDQESAVNWTPSATNQAGSLRLSRGAEIVTTIQSRQEILVWTDVALYSLQYVGAPVVWAAQLVGENISIVSTNSVAYANGITYWMGAGKFYMYDGRVQSLNCDVRKYIYSDIEDLQGKQIFAGTSEAYHEVWWFYCSEGSDTVDRYVIFNYHEGIWYYGTMARTAWLDSRISEYPIAATYSNNIVNHEVGTDDGESAILAAILSSVTSAQFDLDDGHQFMFVNRVIPDVTFVGSSAESPSITMELSPLSSSGSGYNDPKSVGGNNSGAITRSASVPIEEFTSQINVRVRGRQMAVTITSSDLGVAWQLGAPRVDMRPDGRR